MTYRTTEREVVETVDPAAVPAGAQRSGVRTVEYRSNPVVTVERAIVFIFGVIEALIVMRIVLLLVAAREAHAVVAVIEHASEIFVAPFRGIVRLDEVQSGATALDVGAIVALVAWIIIELLVLALVRIFRPAATA